MKSGRVKVKSLSKSEMEGKRREIVHAGGKARRSPDQKKTGNSNRETLKYAKYREDEDISRGDAESAEKKMG